MDTAATSSNEPGKLVSELIARLRHFTNDRALIQSVSVLDQVELLTNCQLVAETILHYASKMPEIRIWADLMMRFGETNVLHGVQSTKGVDFIVKLPSHGSTIDCKVEAKESTFRITKGRTFNVNFAVPANLGKGLQEQTTKFLAALKEKMDNGWTHVALVNEANAAGTSFYMLSYPFIAYYVVAKWSKNTTKPNKKSAVRNVNIHGRVCDICNESHLLRYLETLATANTMPYDEVLAMVAAKKNCLPKDADECRTKK